jgi:hypothetical protein
MMTIFTDSTCHEEAYESISRFGGKEGQDGIDPRTDLGFFDPSGGPFVAVGSEIYWDEIHEATKQEPLTVTRIMDRGAEGLFVEVE